MRQQRLYDDRETRKTEKNENGNLCWAKTKQKKNGLREREREITTTAQSINNMVFESYNAFAEHTGCNVLSSAIGTHSISCGRRAMRRTLEQTRKKKRSEFHLS